MPLVFVKEIKRKFIHLSSSIIPIFAFFFDRELTLIALLLTTSIFIAFDYLRIKKNKFIIEWHNRHRGIFRRFSNQSLSVQRRKGLTFEAVNDRFDGFIRTLFS